MQTSTHSTVYHVIGNVPNALKNSIEGIGLLSNKIVRIFSFLGEGMQRNPAFAATAFAIANLFIFFPLTHLIGSLINKKIHSHPEEMTADEEKMTKVVDCLSAGAAAFTFNFFFSKFTKYPLSNLALLAMQL